MNIRNLMLRDLTSVDPSDTVRTLVETLQAAETSTVPVTDEANRLIGVISETDVLAAAVPRYFELLHSTAFVPDLDQVRRGMAQIADLPVSDFMRKTPICVNLESDDLQATDLMLRRKLRLLPVVDGDGRLVGVLRRRDLLRHLL